MAQKLVEYVGKKLLKMDVHYGTGNWTPGQRKVIDEAVAKKLLAHTDVYLVIGDAEEESQPSVVVAEKEPEKDEPPLLNYATMTKDALAKIIKQRFNIEVDLPGMTKAELVQRIKTLQSQMEG